jgi:hypothetical protein
MTEGITNRTTNASDPTTERKTAVPQRQRSALEVLLVFLKLGVSCFGGPIAHIDRRRSSTEGVSRPLEYRRQHCGRVGCYIAGRGADGGSLLSFVESADDGLGRRWRNGPMVTHLSGGAEDG